MNEPYSHYRFKQLIISDGAGVAFGAITVQDKDGHLVSMPLTIALLWSHPIIGKVFDLVLRETFGCDSYGRALEPKEEAADQQPTYARDEAVGVGGNGRRYEVD